MSSNPAVAVPILGHHYRDYATLMRHVDHIMPGSVRRIVYEDLLDDPEREIRRLLDHRGLDFAPACLTFHATERPVWTPSAAQVRRPLYGHARDAWRTIDAQLGSLRDALGATAVDWR